MRRPEQAIDELFRVADKLMYHRETDALIDVLQRGWDLLRASHGIMGSGIHTWRHLTLDLISYRILTNQPAVDARDPALTALAGQFLDEPCLRQHEFTLAALTGRGDSPLQVVDFPRRCDTLTAALNIAALSREWLGDLWRHHRVPLARGALAVELLQAGSDQPRPEAGPGAAPSGAPPTGQVPGVGNWISQPPELSPFRAGPRALAGYPPSPV